MSPVPLIQHKVAVPGYCVSNANSKQLTKNPRSKAGTLPFPEGDDGVAEDAPVLESNQVKSFLSELDDSKSELSRLRKRVDDAEARAHELDTKLTEERRARTKLTAWVRQETAEAMKLIDATIEAEPSAKISTS